MLGRLGRRTTLAIAAMIGLGASTAGGFTQPAPQVTINVPRAAKKGLFGGHYSRNAMTYGRRGAGITMAQQKRTSKKARNVARHKKHAH